MESRPNFVIIHTDQQRADCLGLHGHPELLTPNLDQLGTQCADFRQAYTTAPICSPALVSATPPCGRRIRPWFRRAFISTAIAGWT